MIKIEAHGLQPVGFDHFRTGIEMDAESAPSIIHVDMDAFYASVEVRDRPELRGQPVIVGGASGARGVVAAASYEARRYGVHSAMPAVTARRLCPRGVFLPVRMSHYAAVSREIREIFHRFTPLVEPLSLDEAFLDVRHSTKLFGTPAEIGQKIKQAIRDELHLVASVGVAPNKFLAKLASDIKKPDGFCVVDCDAVQQFLDPLPVTRIWGVGKVAAQRLKNLGIERIEHLAALPQEVMAEQFGKHGEQLWRLSRGIDGRNVIPDHAAKSISSETTFAVDISDLEALRSCLMDLTEHVAQRLRRHQFRARTINLKLRYDDFTTITRASTLPAASHATDDLWQAADNLLTTRLPDRPLSVRLLGVGATGIEEDGARQQSLFDEPVREKRESVDAVTDQIRSKFGFTAVSRAIRLKGDDQSSK